jgi:hypothetical protein
VQTLASQPVGDVSPAGAGVAPRSSAEETSTSKVAAEITRHDYFARDAGGGLHVYQNGVYVLSGELYVKQRVKAILRAWDLDTKWTSRKAEEVCEYIRGMRRHSGALRPRIVNVQNGLLHVNTCEPDPHA